MILSIVIPCYNESQGLPTLIKKCQEITNENIEIILVDNGSSDSTPEILRPLEKHNPCLRSTRVEQNIGYGNGILAGLKIARGEILGWTHADLQTDPADILAAYQIYERSVNPSNLFVKGARAGRPLLDRVFTAGMSIFETIFMRTGMWDINAQPTVMPRSLYSAWRNPPIDFSLDLYAYYQAKKQGAEIQRIPVRFAPRTFGESHWNTGIVSRIRFIRRTLSYSWKLRKEINQSSNNHKGIE